ncbi:hypothetical protein CPAST_c33070 [Clostridium pasteurianum DSM 525 = ATCC 6013]|uniref:DUF2953 domain-containing protein n=1 Tax=Clostridium pasteurianum DSM 525 = ATCC 6013 TaxID=1262449 RepID=A0A0H3JAA3_CLOPA|nr:DUF2953 domain-containing protein [Clostridium pasteurianum]AJA49373.1 hypothetical protein CPAST_c33070 [Clostridium pasteurianum DSM 525 = ATCC 6013]AJA53361.1 hypothetical protein CLPA_c33070 [Clostridium pasteurianum DSM 525 = ATCC 6013]AOZ76545.1 hypothetical protein AQ983_16065 [Clostridium pasteurianum DSM 525 = ATCC 6013]AOZ80342.1 hypothetical protein AQ984_16060 [Clostridium pasteurianum]ELP58512.1 hypothetical protein F502_14840 [Clostridium pasteurianum DSM 525 = ATCC 6013]
MFGIILAFKIFIIIFIIAVILLIMLLLIPYNYFIEGNTRENFKVKVHVNWLIGIFKIIVFNLSDQFQIEVYFFNLRIYSSFKKNRNKYIENSKSINKKFKINLKNLDLNFLKKVLSYLRDVFLILKPNTFNIKGVYGFEDPFFTGAISSVLSIIKLNFSLVKIDVSPVFDKIVLNILIEAKGKVNLFKIIFVIVKVLREKELRKFILTKV